MSWICGRYVYCTSSVDSLLLSGSGKVMVVSCILTGLKIRARLKTCLTQELTVSGLKEITIANVLIRALTHHSGKRPQDLLW
jgi:hypothetical protein